MAIIPCSECGRPVSDSAFSCPECGNTNLKGRLPAPQEPKRLVSPEPRTTEPAPQYYTRPPPPRPEQFLEAEFTDPKPKRDNTPKGFLMGHADFWVALILYYLGGIVVLYVLYGVMEKDKTVEDVAAAWIFIGLFFLAWHTKNIESEGFKWVVRTILFLFIASVFGFLNV